MNIGVTGSKGVLGKILVKKLKELGYRISEFEGDVRSNEDLLVWVKGCKKLDSVIHLAALVATSVVEEDLLSAFEVNSIGTKNIAEVLKEYSPDTWLFYASTSHVYKPSVKPVSESDDILPISDYGLTKYTGELFARRIYSKLCIGRIFSMYHSTQEPPFLYPNIIKRFRTEDLDKDFELMGGDSLRDFLNAEEVADIIIKLMLREVIGIYNIASGKGLSVKEFVQSIAPQKIRIKNIGRSDSLVANIDKLSNVLSQYEGY